MTSFITGLWQNIFEPGANEQLVIATHVSFAALLATLAWLIYVTRSIHFMALFGIGLCLWIAVIWFVQELKNAQLKNNEELMVGNSDEKPKMKRDTASTTTAAAATVATGSELKTRRSGSRKV